MCFITHPTTMMIGILTLSMFGVSVHTLASVHLMDKAIGFSRVALVEHRAFRTNPKVEKL